MRSGLALFAALVVGGVLFGANPHPHFWWERIPAFAAVLGFAATWLLVFTAKKLLAPLLQRPDGEGEE